jgi:hypothetical protein
LYFKNIKGLTMAKFLKFAIAPSVDSGTTDGVPSGANDLIDSGQNFLTTVKAGDLVHNTTDDAWDVVAAVVDNDNLTLVTGTVATAKAYTIYSGNTALYEDQLVSAENVAIVEQASQSTATIAYISGVNGSKLITVTHGKLATTTSNDMRATIQNAILDLHAGKTKPEAFKVVSMPTGIAVTGIATT